MSSWLALFLPELPLQLALRRFDPALARTLVLAIVAGPVQRSTIACCSRPARRAGIVPGMKLAAAQALARDLITIEHAPPQEHAALQELAAWAYQFSPAIVPFCSQGGSGLVLETGASERLFGGPDALRARITRGLRALGYRAADASAATPAAARVLARAVAARLRPPVPGAGLRAALEPLPLLLLEWDEATIQTLHTLGLDTIGQLLSLPREAFGRRFGAQRLIDLDRLLGVVADPQPPFTPPERFTARIDLAADLVETARLLVPAQRLLQLLEGYLRGRGAGALALHLHAHHNRRRAQALPPTAIALSLAVPERDARRLLHLFTERLARVSLPEPVVVLELELDRMAPWRALSDSFLPPAAHTPAQGIDALQLAQTLHARLGSEGVFQLQALSDHRPERAYRVLPLTPDPSDRHPRAAPTPAQRPVLILPRPRHLPTPAGEDDPPRYGGPLALLAGPERIEAGWWDLGRPGKADIQRDYFVARNGRGQTLWIYRELAGPRHWFLHGFFS